MGEVVVLQVKIPPKVQQGVHLGHRYTLKYDPNAPPNERWAWIVNYVVTYQYVGVAATLAKAESAAHRKIRGLVNG